MQDADRVVVEATQSLRHRKKDRTRRAIQAEALRLFAEKGFQATTVEEIAAAADVAPRTFFRYFPTKEEVVFWSDYQPALGDIVAARPAEEPAAEALRRGVIDGLAVFYSQDRDRLLERITLAYRTPALHPRLRQQQAAAAGGMAEILAGRLGVPAGDLEVRALAAAITSALWVAVEEWQAHDGESDLGALIDRAIGTVLDGSLTTERQPEGGSEGREPTPREAVWALSTAGFPARCLHTVADLGIADRIDDLPVPVLDLAAAADVDPDALDRVLRLLAAHGVFHQSTGGFGHTPASRLLRSDHPMSMSPFVAMAALPMMWGSLTELTRSVRTGRPALEALEPDGLWAYLRDRPDEAEVFARAMTAKASGEIDAVLATYDFSRFATIADIGGGRGHLLRAVLDATPSAKGILFDLPEVVDSLDLRHPRMTATAGNFFVDALPAADAYVLMDVLHDWPDQECVAILRAVRHAAPVDATLLILEGIVAQEAADPGSATLDVVMLALTGGRERTPDQLETLLRHADFRLVKIIDTPSPIRIAESHAF